MHELGRTGGPGHAFRHLPAHHGAIPGGRPDRYFGGGRQRPRDREPQVLAFVDGKTDKPVYGQFGVCRIYHHPHTVGGCRDPALIPVELGATSGKQGEQHLLGPHRVHPRCMRRILIRRERGVRQHPGRETKRHSRSPAIRCAVIHQESVFRVPVSCRVSAKNELV